MIHPEMEFFFFFFLGGGGGTYHFDFDLLDLEAQNDGPDETEDETRVAVDDILGADALQADLRASTDGRRKTR